MSIRAMTPEDKAFVMRMIRRVNDTRYEYMVHTRSGYVICDGKQPVGVL